jgi:hypothetical protein
MEGHMAHFKDEPSMKNVKVLREFRIRGKAQPVGKVMPKSDFTKNSDWRVLCAMKPPKLVQTDEKPSMPKTAPRAPGA